MEIKYMNLFDTKTEKEMLEYMNDLSGNEKRLAYMIYGLTWNMMAKKVNNMEAEK